MLDERKRLFQDTIRALSTALDLDDGQKLHHAWRVALVARHVATELQLPNASYIFYAGLLHDVGGVGLSDHVVHGAVRGFLDPQVRSHALDGARILRPFSLLSPIELLVADHHERFDGRGFPRGKRGHDVALGTYAIALADTLDVTLRACLPEARGEVALRLLETQGNKAWPGEVTEAARAVLTRRAGFIEDLYDEERLGRAVAAEDFAPAGLARLSPVEMLSQLLWVFARVIDAKHEYTMGHSVRVAWLAHRIGRGLGRDVINDWDIVWAGLLHDAGKVGVPRALLEMPRALGPEEWGLVRRHAHDSETIISSITDLADLAYPAAAHHERWDGRGYPRGNAGEDIPLLGRVLAYADAYDAMRSARAYRGALDHDVVMARIRADVGAQFDPHLADVALHVLDEAGRGPWPLPASLTGTERFFEAELADIRRAVPHRRAAVVRHELEGALLLEVEPWSLLALTPDLEPVEGEAVFCARAGDGPCDAWLQVLDEEGRRRLRGWFTTAAVHETFTTFVFTRTGAPLELLARRGPAGFEVYHRCARSRVQTMKRIALFYRNFLASAEGACFLDRSGAVVDVNRTFLELYRCQLREVVGAPPALLRPPPNDGHEFRALLDEAQERGGSWRGEVTTYARDGAEIPVLLTITSVRDASGGLVGHVVRVVDVPARPVQRELEGKGRELERLVRAGDAPADPAGVRQLAARPAGATAEGAPRARFDRARGEGLNRSQVGDLGAAVEPRQEAHRAETRSQPRPVGLAATRRERSAAASRASAATVRPGS